MTVSTYSQADGAKDGHDSGTISYVDSTYLHCQVATSATSTGRSVAGLQFLIDVPAGSTINSASLTIYCQHTSFARARAVVRVEPEATTSAAAWSNTAGQSPYDRWGTLFGHTAAADSAGVNWDYGTAPDTTTALTITGLGSHVQTFIDDTDYDESDDTRRVCAVYLKGSVYSGGDSTSFRFRTRNEGTTYDPELTIDYTAPSGGVEATAGTASVAHSAGTATVTVQQFAPPLSLAISLASPELTDIHPSVSGGINFPAPTINAGTVDVTAGAPSVTHAAGSASVVVTQNVSVTAGAPSVAHTAGTATVTHDGAVTAGAPAVAHSAGSVTVATTAAVTVAAPAVAHAAGTAVASTQQNVDMAAGAPTVAHGAGTATADVAQGVSVTVGAASVDLAPGQVDVAVQQSVTVSAGTAEVPVSAGSASATGTSASAAVVGPGVLAMSAGTATVAIVQDVSVTVTAASLSVAAGAATGDGTTSVAVTVTAPGVTVAAGSAVVDLVSSVAVTAGAPSVSFTAADVVAAAVLATIRTTGRRWDHTTTGRRPSLP
jgi:hypothetical protein